MSASDLDQSGVLGRVEDIRRYVERADRGEDYRQLTSLICRDQLQRGLGACGQALDTTAKHVLKAGCQRDRVQQGCASGKLLLRQRGRKLQQRQRVACRLANQTLTHRWRGALGPPRQQLDRAIAIEPGEHQLGDAGCVESAALLLARREQEHSSLRTEAPRGERQRIGARRVQPLGIVDQA